jgi:hypothetical protein
MSKNTTVTVTLSADAAAYLRQLAKSSAIESGKIEDVASHLLHSAADGVRRPGSWERGWVQQAFGDFPEGPIDPDKPYMRRPRG